MARRPIKFKTCPDCCNRWEVGDFHPKDGICWRCWDKIHSVPAPVAYPQPQSSALTVMQGAISAGNGESWD